MSSQFENNADIIEIKRAYKRECQHGPFIVDMSLDSVECEKCHDLLSPMWVLRELMHHKSKYNDHIWKKHEELKRVRDDLEKAKDKARCKCKHCGKMTPIIKFRSV